MSSCQPPHSTDADDGTCQPALIGGDTMLPKVLTAMACRLLLNTARRFAYPFAPALSRGLDVPLLHVTSLIAVNQFSTLPALFSGPLSDRFGYRRMLLGGMVCMSAGMMLAALLPTYLSVMIGLLLAGLGKSIFDPAIQAFIGSHVPFGHRGRMVGILELSWSGSALLGIPLAGILIDKIHWSAPFWILGTLGAMGCILLVRMIPAKPSSTGTPCGAPSNIRTDWSQLLKQRPAAGLLGFGFWTSVGNDQLFVTYGAWMERSFELGVVALGLGTAIVGAAELCGEGLTMWVGDRIGLKRAVIAGSLLATAGYVLLPFAGAAMPLAWTGLFFIFLAYEFSMVSGISLGTEVLPGMRATMMAAFYAAAGLGRMAGAFMGGMIWLKGGILAVAVVSALSAAASVFCLVWGLAGTTD